MACTMEDLIQRVRDKPILWDLNHMYFRDVGRKRDTWDVVAEECGLYDGEEARQAWAKLRNSHREAMRRRLEDTKMKPWKYEDQMEFLLANSCCDIRKSTKADTSVTDNETEEKLHIEPLHVELEMDDVVDSPENETSTTTAELDSKKGKNHKTLRKTNAKRERDSDNYNPTSEAEFNSSERNKRMPLKRPMNDEKVSDGLTELFTGLCEKTRNLPKHLQLRVQREVFDSVTKAEEEALRLSNSSTPIRKKVIPKRKVNISKKIRKVHATVPENIYESSSHRQSDDMNVVSDSNRSQLESPVDPIGNIVIKTDPIEISLESDLSL